MLLQNSNTFLNGLKALALVALISIACIGTAAEHKINISPNAPARSSDITAIIRPLPNTIPTGLTAVQPARNPGPPSTTNNQLDRLAGNLRARLLTAQDQADTVGAMDAAAANERERCSCLQCACYCVGGSVIVGITLWLALTNKMHLN